MQIKLLVEGGSMKPGPALSQKLGPAGININEVISQINEATKEFNGMKVPVELEVDMGSKTFEIQVFSPPVSELLKKEIGVAKASGLQDKSKAGNISIEQAIKVAKAKMGNLLCNNLTTALKTVVGSCTSLGILVESKSPVKVGEEIDEGLYDKQIEEEITETPEEKKKELDAFFAELKEAQDKQLKLEQKDEEAKKETAVVEEVKK
ncbi:50S ribosomal protein L11 [archaeon]|jgi:large subunit ribosomal protein L11|nr:50S ribosomal protein L11 [archaeon]